MATNVRTIIITLVAGATATTGAIVGESISRASDDPPPMMPINKPPVAKCTDRIVIADDTCHGAVSINNGSYDPDNDRFSCTQSPSGPFGLGTDNVKLTCTDTRGASSSCTAKITVVDRTPPALSCPADQTLECNNGKGGATGTWAVSATDNCDAHPNVTCAPPSGTVFALGTSAVACTASDTSGNVNKCIHRVSVVDTTPPVVVTKTPAELWPPNHRYHKIDLTDCIASIRDACRGPLDIPSHAKLTGCTSNEPDIGLGSGDMSNDCVILNSRSVNVRVERSGGGTGRVYTIRYTVTDDAHNATNGTCTVTVPHDQGH